MNLNERADETSSCDLWTLDTNNIRIERYRFTIASFIRCISRQDIREEAKRIGERKRENDKNMLFRIRNSPAVRKYACVRVSRTPIAIVIGRDSKSISVKKECPKERNVTGFSKERSVILSPLDLALSTWKEATKTSLDVDMPVERAKNERGKER
jgi:hypothetical protein